MLALVTLATATGVIVAIAVFAAIAALIYGLLLFFLQRSDARFDRQSAGFSRERLR
ncbi:MAG: hypothetical protein QM648_01455 [Solirubrobacterales bacterium]